MSRGFPRAKLLRYALQECNELMSTYGKGVQSEGFVGGFAEALMMLPLLDARVVPNDRFGIFEKAAARIVAEREAKGEFSDDD